MAEIEKYNDSENALYSDVCSIIDTAKVRIASYVNTDVCMTYWRVGTRIKEDILFNKRAEYGKQIVKNLSLKLNQRYGKGWGTRPCNIVYALRILFPRTRLSTQRVDNYTGLI